MKKKKKRYWYTGGLNARPNASRLRALIYSTNVTARPVYLIILGLALFEFTRDLPLLPERQLIESITSLIQAILPHYTETEYNSHRTSEQPRCVYFRTHRTEKVFLRRLRSHTYVLYVSAFIILSVHLPLDFLKH